MTDRLDVRIRAIVTELVDQPVEPPDFPLAEVQIQPVAPSRYRLPGWAMAAVAFVAVLIVGLLALLLTSILEGPPPVDVPPSDVVETFRGSVNDGDLAGAMATIAPDAQCVAPTLPTCEDLIGFFIAAEAEIVFTECRMENPPHLQCAGYIHMAVHDALGISEEQLASSPNFPPAFIVEGGRISQFNFHSSFTGDGNIDDRLWSYLLEIEADFVNEEGVPLFSAEIVPQFIDAARQFSAQSGGS